MNDNITEIKRVTWVGVFTNILLSIFKVTCGLSGGSQVVVADGIHSLSDLVSDFAILIGVKFWVKPADDSHPHGHHKIEILVTLIIGIILMFVATGILWNSMTTLHEQHSSPPGLIALFAAIISIIVKEILYRWTNRIGNKIKSMPLVANAWHHRSDALSSIPVVIAVAVAIVKPDWAFVDHVGAVIVSLFIFQASFKIIYPSFSKLLDLGALKDDVLKIQNITLSIDGVLGVHGVRARYVGSTKLAVDLHIEVQRSMTVHQGHLIAKSVKAELIENGPEVIDVVVHLEPFIEDKTP